MKLTYYGTAAGAGIPEIYCSCRVCEQARAARGKNIRTRSQAVLDGCISIDFPVDVLAHTIHGGLDMRPIKHVLITHNHHDHFMPADVMSRPQGVEGAVHFYLSEKSGKDFRASLEATEEAYRSGRRIRTGNFRVEAHTVSMFAPFSLMDYTVTPLHARHAEAIESLNYLIERDGKVLLWAHDTGLFHSDTLTYLRDLGVHLDLVSLDCTLKRGEQITKSHMDLDWCIETANVLRAQGNADDSTVFVLSHIGHLVERTHDELVAEASPLGFLVAYDGMQIEF